MRTLDWIVLISFLAFTVLFGIFKGRGSKNIRGYMLANKSMPWYAVALSIMATQASAITFVSIPGQAYADGMRFLQYYFGLPIAMVTLCIIAVPLYHRLNVFTAYEFLEKRFDLKTRALTGFIFLMQRGLSASLSLYAPAIILSVVLGWDIRITVWIIGSIVIVYTVIGGVISVNWNDFQQFLIVMGSMILAFFMIVRLLPHDVSFGDAVSVAGAMGRLNVVDFSFNWENKYNFWSGIIGGLFLSLAYFGTDQSQVQRYLTAKSVSESRLGLLFNGMAKIPMQFFILFVGAMVFVFYQFVTPPLFFNKQEAMKTRSGAVAGEFQRVEERYQKASNKKQEEIRKWLSAKDSGAAKAGMLEAYRNAEAVREEGIGLIHKNDPEANTNDTNFIFLTFVTQYLPAGIVGLIIVVVFGATMSSTSSELNSLATSTIVDIYQRLIKTEGSDRHYLFASRIATAIWGLFAIVLSERASRLGSLVEAVNILGSLFYGTVLGVFMVAFFSKKVPGTAAFIAAIVGEAIVLGMFFFTKISFLWYNLFGCLAVVVVANLLSLFLAPETKNNTA